MGKSTISMVIFNSYFDITRGYSKRAAVAWQAWFRNTWSWNHSKRPSMTYVADKRRIEILSGGIGFQLFSCLISV